jgi:hypothetical protein
MPGCHNKRSATLAEVSYFKTVLIFDLPFVGAFPSSQDATEDHECVKRLS